jgi:hypothetical protein
MASPSNVFLSSYDPVRYALDALPFLQKALGMAARVHRGYSAQKSEKGKLISIPSPQSFTAGDAPAAITNLTPSEVQVSLDYWKEVKIAITDKEISHMGGNIDLVMQHHLPRAVYGLADAIDLYLCDLALKVPWFVDAEGTTSTKDITNARKILFDNKVDVNGGDIHMMVNSDMEANLLNLAAFNTSNGAGQAGVETQLRGTIGTRFGAEIFANQNVISHVKGTCSVSTLAVNLLTAVGSSTIALDAVSVTGTLVSGDVFSIAGDSQKYAVTATATASANAFASVSIWPVLQKEAANNAVVTVYLDDHVANLMFHRNAFCLATAPLPDIADGLGLGVKIASVSDPITNLSIRNRLYYDGDYSCLISAFDILFGFKCLVPNMACRIRG